MLISADAFTNFRNSIAAFCRWQSWPICPTGLGPGNSHGLSGQARRFREWSPSPDAPVRRHEIIECASPDLQGYSDFPSVACITKPCRIAAFAGTLQTRDLTFFEGL